VHLLLFCTKTNKCTIITQIITDIDYKLSEDDTIVSKHVGVR